MFMMTMKGSLLTLIFLGGAGILDGGQYGSASEGQ